MPLQTDQRALPKEMQQEEFFLNMLMKFIWLGGSFSSQCSDSRKMVIVCLDLWSIPAIIDLGMQFLQQEQWEAYPMQRCKYFQVANP